MPQQEPAGYKPAPPNPHRCARRIWENAFGKVTVDIPDAILRRAKSEAATRGVSLREFVIQSLEEKLVDSRRSVEKPWMKLAGRLKHLRRETARLNRVIENETEQIDPEAWD